MMNFLHLLLIFSLLSIHLQTFAEVRDLEVKVKKQLDPDQILFQLADSPELNEAFTQVQTALLRTYGDKVMFDALEHNPLLRDVSEMLELTLKENIRMTLGSGLLGSITAQRQYPKLRKWAEEAARNDGCSEEQIKNMKVIVKKGPLNAYTFSFSKDEIVLVIFTDLEKELNEKQIKAVIEHEIGHVIAKHVSQGIKMSAMSMLLGKIFLSGGIGVEEEASSELVQKLKKLNINHLKNLTEANAKDAYDRFWLRMFDVLNMGFNADETSAASVRSVKTAKRNQFLEAFKSMMTGLEELHSNSPSAATTLIRDYLDDILRAITPMEVPKQLRRYYSFLRLMVSQKEALGESSDSLHRLPVTLNAEEYLEHMLILTAAISREQETTADRFALAGISSAKDTASVFQAFSGADRTQNLSTIISDAEQRLKEFYRTFNDTERRSIIGDADNSHPENAIRTSNAIYYGQSVDIIAMKNPLLRLVAFYKHARQEIFDIDHQIKEQIIIIKNIKKTDPKLEDPELKEYFLDLERGSSHLSQLRQDLTTTALYLQSAIIQQITKKSLNAKNEALRDVLDYYLASQQVEIKRRDEEAAARDDAKTTGVLKNLSAKAEVTFFDRLVEQILKSLPNSNFAKEVKNLFLRKAASVPEVRIARTELRRLIPFSTPESVELGISLTPPPEIPSSNVSSRFVTKTRGSEKPDSPTVENVEDVRAEAKRACDLLLGKLGQYSLTLN